MTTPTPGQPLSEADVSLLQPGDLYLRSGAVCRHVGVCADEDGPHGLTGVDLSDDGFFYNVPIRHFTFLGRPDQDGWIAWSGGENPVPGVMVDAKTKNGFHLVDHESERCHWQHIVAFRLSRHAPVSRPADGVEGRDYPAEFEAWWATYKHRNRDVANYPVKKQIAFDAFYFGALTPPAEPVSRPAGEVMSYCKTCNGPRAVSPCHKCGGELKPAADGWEWPELPSIDRIRALAREVGYGVGVHGSLERDLDLIAIPWTAEAVSPPELAAHIAAGLPGQVLDDVVQDKPSGRWSCNINPEGWFKVIDLSVMPPIRPAGEGEREAVARLIWERFAPSSDMDEANAMRGEYVLVADAIIDLLSSAAPDAGGGLQAAVFGLQTIAEDASLVTIEQMRAVAAGAILNAFGAKGSPGGMAEALRSKSDENRLHLLPQPGPASEGDPAHD